MLFAIFVETFQMGKIHKDIAMFMVEAAKNEEYNDQTLVKVRSNSELPPACLTWDEKKTKTDLFYRLGLEFLIICFIVPFKCQVFWVVSGCFPSVLAVLVFRVC